MLVVIVGKAAAIEPQIADKGIAVREDRLQGPDQRRRARAAKTRPKQRSSAATGYRGSLRSANQRPKNASA